ncbi:MAG: hypothetical protein ACK4V1_06230 [Burkholderiaceae bacterium]
MCGIAGFSGPFERELLARMSAAVAHRGPDGQGICFSRDGAIGLAHRRLAIIDLSPTGAQPMTDTATGVTITYNGEIYNDRELRARLEAADVSFFGRSAAALGVAWAGCLRSRRFMPCDTVSTQNPYEGRDRFGRVPSRQPKGFSRVAGDRGGARDRGHPSMRDVPNAFPCGTWEALPLPARHRPGQFPRRRFGSERRRFIGPV